MIAVTAFGCARAARCQLQPVRFSRIRFANLVYVRKELVRRRRSKGCEFRRRRRRRCCRPTSGAAPKERSFSEVLCTRPDRLVWARSNEAIDLRAPFKSAVSDLRALFGFVFWAQSRRRRRRRSA